MSITNEIVPVCFNFDNNYLLPARVAIFSMLKNANKNYFYKIHILFSQGNLSINSQSILKKVAGLFQNASITFHEVQLKDFELWDKTFQAHFSKEIFIKLKLASLLPQYDKIICSDVDVVFTGDISESYKCYDITNYLIAGVRSMEVVDEFFDLQKYSYAMKEHLKGGIGAGFLVLNLKSIRSKNIEKKMLKNLNKHYQYITQPEQDIINLTVPKDKIFYLPLKFMFCTYMYSIILKGKLNLRCNGNWVKYFLLRLGLFKIKADKYHSEKEIKQALYEPIQIHYATGIKPWNTLFCYKKVIWYKYKILVCLATCTLRFKIINIKNFLKRDFPKI